MSTERPKLSQTERGRVGSFCSFLLPPAFAITPSVSVSLIYTKSREYTATNKGETTRRMLDVARNIRGTFTGTRAHIVSALSRVAPSFDSKYRDDGHGRYRGAERRQPFYRRA